MAKDYRLQERLGFRLSRLSKLMQSRLDTQLEAHDLTRLEWCVLASVGLEGRDAPSDLAEHIGITRPAVSRLLKRLVARGLMERTLTDADGRGRRISLTGTGQDKVALCLPLVTENETYFTAKLNAAQQQSLDEVLDMMLSGETGAFDDI